MMQVPVRPLVTATGCPRSDGSSRCSTWAKKQSISTSAIRRSQGSASIAAKLAGNDALDLNALRGVGYGPETSVGGDQLDQAATAPDALQGRLEAIDQYHGDVAAAHVDGRLHDNIVTFQDACLHHGVALDLQYVATVAKQQVDQADLRLLGHRL